jgi:type IV pilus assembly protein PilW
MHIARNRQTGLTLIELMIVMVLALAVSAAILNVFASNRQSFKQAENILRMQDDARHALRELALDLSMAGHYADLLFPGAVTPDPTLSVGTDCGPAGMANWIYRLRDPATANNLSITAIDNVTVASANAAHSCIGGAELATGTDIVAIKRVAGTASAAPVAGQVYLRTNGTVGLLYEEPVAAPAVAVPAPFAEWEYRPRIYYIRNFADTAGDDIPTLCRKTLAAAPATVVTECLAVGIENMQLQYGIDTGDNGNPNMFLDNPSLEQLQAAVAVRITLLARTADPEPGYTNSKTYMVGNAPPHTPADSYRRRVLTMTVGIKNLRSLRRIGN